MSKSKKKGGEVDDMLPNLKKIISDLGKDKFEESIIIKRKDIKDPNAHRIRKVSQPKNNYSWKVVKEKESSSTDLLKEPIINDQNASSQTLEPPKDSKIDSHTVTANQKQPP